MRPGRYNEGVTILKRGTGMNRTHIRAFTLVTVSCFVLLAGRAHALTGDITDDLKVTTSDAILALRIAGGFWAPMPLTMQNGDVAGGQGNTPDGRMDIQDAVRILRAATGTDPFPAPIISAGMSGSVTLTGDATKDWSLPRAWWMRGTVTGLDLGNDPEPAQTISFTPGVDAFAVNSGPVSDVGYVVPVRNGLNAVALDLEYLKYGENGLEMDYTARVPVQPSSVDVTVDSSQNFTFTAPTAPGTVSGSITAPGWDIYELVLNQSTGSHARAIMENSPADAYTLVASPDTGYFGVEYAVGGDDGLTDAYATLSGMPVTVVSNGQTTVNLTLPSLFTLSGTLSGGDFLWIESISALPGGGVVDLYRDQDDGGTYTLATPQGPVSLVMGIDEDLPNGTRSLAFVQPFTVPAGGGSANFTLPTLPTLRTLSGVVKDAAGNPAANVDVTINDATGGSTPSNGWHAFADIMTGSDGAYSVQLPDGSYEVQLTPPAPQGPPSGIAASRQSRRGHRWWRIGK